MIRRRRALVFTAVMALVFGWAGGWTPQPDPDRAPDRQLAQPDDPSQPAPLEGTTAIEGSPEAAGRALSPTPKRVEGSWFVELREGLDPQRVSADLARRYGGRAEHVYVHTLHGFNFRGTDEHFARLRDDTRVASVAPDYEVHAVDEITNPIKRIRASHPTENNAFDQGFRGNGVNIGILDTGVDIDHPDLVANMAPSSRWRNCMDSGGPADVNDVNGHGTRTAGNAAAVANTIGVRGVASEATIIPVKVLGNGGGGSTATVACGVEHLTALALANPGERFIGNMSLAGGGTSSTCGTTGLRHAICDSVAVGVVHTAAAGNAHRNAASYWPASFPEVITVSAMNDADGEPGGDSLASFSNFGDVVDVIAPGVNVISPTAGGGYTPTGTSGTSRAAPHAAGVAAIILGIDPGLSPQEVVDLMLATGECPNGLNTGAGPCPSGVWSGDTDGETEPLVNALNAGLSADPSIPRISFNQPSATDPLVGNNVLIEFEVEDLDESAVAEPDVASVVLKADATVLEDWTSHSIATPFTHVFDSSDLTDGSHSLSVTVVDNDAKTRSLSKAAMIANAPPVFSEDFEPAPTWTFDGLWHVADAGPGSTPCGPQPYPSYRRSLYYGQDATCNYDTGKANRASAISPLITGVGDDAVLTFGSFRSVETTGKKRDIARLYVSYHGKKWKKVWEQTAKDPADTGWTSNTIDLNPTGAGTVMLRFYFKADRRENLSAGWFVDDILISSTPNDQPVLSSIAPTNGGTVSGTVSVQIGGTDEDGPGTLTGALLVDDAFQDPLFWDGTDSYDVTWDSTSVPDGSYTLEAHMTDSGGAEASVLIDVNVDN